MKSFNRIYKSPSPAEGRFTLLVGKTGELHVRQAPWPLCITPALTFEAVHRRCSVCALVYANIQLIDCMAEALALAGKSLILHNC